MDKSKFILQETCSYFQNKYPQIWSKTVRARRPYIYFNSFQEACMFIYKYLNKQIKTEDDMIKIITQYNNSYSHWSIDKFPKINDKMHEKAREWKFYLGLFQYKYEKDYGFIWARNIVEHYTGITIKPVKDENKRKTISKALRSKIWNNNIGSNFGQAYCITCNNNIISMMDFECGHIVSHKNGGEVNEDNLLPICGTCNKSMGITSMDTFVLEQFPNNYDNFVKRTYRNITQNIEMTEHSKPKKTIYKKLFNII